MSGGASPGEVGGIVAGIMTVLVAVGGGLRWFLVWSREGSTSREAKLERWHDELEAKEEKIENERSAFHARIEGQLADLSERLEARDGQVMALRFAFELIAAELRRVDPANPALGRAQQLLTAAFPLDAAIPRDMLATVLSIRESGGA